MSERNVLLVIVDPANGKVPDSVIYGALKGDARVEDVWTYTPYTFLLLTTASVRDIKDVVRRVTREAGVRFLVTKADISETNGWLPRRAWDQFREWRTKGTAA